MWGCLSFSKSRPLQRVLFSLHAACCEKHWGLCTVCVLCSTGQRILSVCLSLTRLYLPLILFLLCSGFSICIGYTPTVFLCLLFLSLCFNELFMGLKGAQQTPVGSARAVFLRTLARWSILNWHCIPHRFVYQKWNI